MSDLGVLEKVSAMELEERLRSLIRDVPDFPKPGIMFKDITPLLADGEAFRLCILEMAKQVKGWKAQRLVAIESRGFLFASALAFELGFGIIPVRKPKKLPYKTTRVQYALEYGMDSLEMHVDALNPSERVVVVDDVLATGGTALATAQLVEKSRAQVVGLLFLSELEFLKWREKLNAYRVSSLLSL